MNAEPLIKKRWRKTVVPDGRPYIIDIESGRVVSRINEGDLKIRLYTNQELATQTRQYSWGVEIEAVNGGIMESKDAFLYQAPAKGYVDSLSWEQGANDISWSRDITRKLYVKLKKDGSYASFKIDVKIYHSNKARLLIESLVNPSGSRNLEYDPKKEIRQSR